MKVTKEQLKQIIKEELEAMVKESWRDYEGKGELPAGTDAVKEKAHQMAKTDKAAALKYLNDTIAQVTHKPTKDTLTAMKFDLGLESKPTPEDNPYY